MLSSYSIDSRLSDSDICCFLCGRINWNVYYHVTPQDSSPSSLVRKRCFLRPGSRRLPGRRKHDASRRRRRGIRHMRSSLSYYNTCVSQPFPPPSLFEQYVRPLLRQHMGWCLLRVGFSQAGSLLRRGWGGALSPTVVGWSTAWLRVPQTLLPHKGHPVPLHVVPLLPRRRAVTWWLGGSPTCSGTGWSGGAVGPLGVPGLPTPLDARLPHNCQGESWDGAV
jgi:hypothetical protein